MSTFQPVKIKSVCEKVASGGTTSRKRADYFTNMGGHLWVKSKELLEKGIADTEEKITKEGLQNSSAKLYPANTVLVAMYGVNAGQLGWLERPATVNQAICALVINPKRADWRFVYYSLLQSRQNLISQARGGAQPNLNKEMVENFEISMTSDLPTQTRIASVLSAYDDLIENNEKRIKALEEMAELLYTEWFVKFKFPGHEKIKLVDSGTSYGKIPEGWKIKKFAEIFDIKYGKNLPTSKINDTGKYKVYGAGGVIGYYDQKNIETKTSLVTCRGNGSGTVWRTSGEGFVTNNAFTINGKENFIVFEFIFNTLKNCNINSSISGSAQPQITIENINFVQLLIPPKDLVCEYVNQVKNNYVLSDELRNNNQNLSNIRDLLIPQLVTGKRELKNI